MTNREPLPQIDHGVVARKLKATYPVAEALGHDMTGLVALADITPDELVEHLRTPGALESLDAAKIRAQADGSLLETRALVMMDKVLDIIQSEIPGMDAGEAVDISKVLQRILEAADKRRAAQRDDGKKQLPTFIFNFDLSAGQMTANMDVIQPGEDGAYITDVADKLTIEGGST